MHRMGIDPGTRRIGLALSEPDSPFAFPYKTIQHKDMANAAMIISDEIGALGIEEVVIGLPLRTDGSEGMEAQKIRGFAKSIQEATQVSIILWDERLTTVAAEQLLSEAQVFGKRRRKTVDQVASVLILQSYLDSKRESHWTEETVPEIERASEPAPRRRGRPNRVRRRGY